jgi:hypothetical protein
LRTRGRREDRPEHGVEIVQNVFVAKTHDDQALLLKLGCPVRIVGCERIMLPTVDFHDKLSIEAEEIDRVGENWNLPLELQSFKATPSQRLPENILGRGRCPT